MLNYRMEKGMELFQHYEDTGTFETVLLPRMINMQLMP